jgi:hypothetical protein
MCTNCNVYHDIVCLNVNSTQNWFRKLQELKKLEEKSRVCVHLGIMTSYESHKIEMMFCDTC